MFDSVKQWRQKQDTKRGVIKICFTSSGLVGVIVKKLAGPTKGLYAWRLYHIDKIVFVRNGDNRIISRELVAIKQFYIAGGYVFDVGTAYNLLDQAVGEFDLES